MGSVILNSAVPQTSKFKNLQLGWPSPRLCERAGVQQAAEAVLAETSDMSKVLVYGPHKGSIGFRQSVAKWLTTVYSPEVGPVDPDCLCLTSGASQNLANIATKFADPGYTRCVFMVEPTYFLACPIFEDAGFRNKLRGVPETLEDGIDLEFLESRIIEIEAKSQSGSSGDAPQFKTGPGYPYIYRYLVYVNPTFSNPNSKTMSLDCRSKLVSLARKYEVLLISDYVYDFLSRPEDSTAPCPAVPKAPARLVDLDRAMPGRTEFGNAVSNGSFSKLIGPGIRVGWAEGSSEFVKHLGNCGSSSSGGAPSHFASTLVDMLRTERLQDCIRDVLIPTYRERYTAMMSAIDQHLRPRGVTVLSRSKTSLAATGGMSGGYFANMRLPPNLPQAKTVAAVALQVYDVRVAFGGLFTVYGDDSSTQRALAEDEILFGRCIRLCWAWHEADDIREAVERLGVVLDDIRQRMSKGLDVGAGYSIGLR